MRSLEEFVAAQDLHESGIARIRRMLWGEVPFVGTLGILTANNPNGEPPVPGGSEDQNRVANWQLNKALEGDLRAMFYGPIKIKGKFGQEENSFLVPNIAREQIVALSKKYGQQAVIWGSKQLDEYRNPFFRFEYIEGDTTINVRDVHVGNQDVQNRNDFYTAKKGRKFVIPFFSDPYANLTPGAKRGTLEPTAATESFFIPLFDDPAVEVEQDHEPSYYPEEITSSTVDTVMVIRECEEELKELGETEQWYESRRGMILEGLRFIAKHNEA